MIRKIMVAAVAVVASAAFANIDSIKDDFSLEFNRIVLLIKQGAWVELEQYETENTKCGFGPNEEGQGCVGSVLSRDSECKNEVLFSLNQGCRIAQSEEQLTCIAPRQYSEPDVLLPLNSRISLIYEKATSQVTIDYLIWGGD